MVRDTADGRVRLTITDNHAPLFFFNLRVCDMMGDFKLQIIVTYRSVYNITIIKKWKEWGRYLLKSGTEWANKRKLSTSVLHFHFPSQCK